MMLLLCELYGNAYLSIVLVEDEVVVGEIT